MHADPLAEVLGRHTEGVVRLELVHQRTRSFRLWGLFEMVLKVFAFIILIPLWIVLLFSAFSLDGDGDGGGGGGGTKKDLSKRYGKSSLFRYHHDLLLRLIGADGAVLDTRTVRAESESHAAQLVATVLAYAERGRLVVSESADVNPSKEGPVESLKVWYGGRALMSPPGLRSADALESELLQVGFEIERDNDQIVIRRAFAPMHLWVPILLMVLIVGGTLIIGVVGTPLSLILGAPFLLFALWVARREVGGALFELLCGLLRMHERFELRLTPGTISYSHTHAWRRSSGSTEGANLVAVGFSGGLGPAPTIDRQAPRLRVVGREQSLGLPSRLTEGVGPMFAEWLASTMIGLSAAQGAHDFRSRCAYCGSLYDLDAHPGCPKCGAGNIS